MLRLVALVSGRAILVTAIIAVGCATRLGDGVAACHAPGSMGGDCTDPQFPYCWADGRCWHRAFDVDASEGADGGTNSSDVALPDTGPPDASGATCPETFAGCTSFEDHTSDTGDVVVRIVANGYVPACVRIRTGRSVMLPSAGAHPLQGATCSGTQSPIPTEALTSGGTFRFPFVGTYGYHCAMHGDDLGHGMAGLILVQ